MNLYKVNDTYFDKVFKDSNIDEAKGRVLLVDKFTMSIISICYSQSQLLSQDIILIDLIENFHQLDQMKHLNCIVYIKPVTDSIEFLTKELQAPHFHDYKVYFNNIINKNQLERIAESDKFEVVSNIVELFQDYLVINANLFTITSTSIIDETNKLVSLLLSIKKFPIIQYENNSLSLKKLSSEILYQINSNLNNNLFENLNYDTVPVLLLFDRFNDPITPLINPWTYQAMIHELIGINKNIVEINGEKILLDDQSDDFLSQSLYLNYGDLTELFQTKVEKFKKESNANVKTSNLVELKKILTRLPDFKKKSSNIMKHLNVLTELDAQISKQNLWEISELQQTIICNLDTKINVENSLIRILSNDSVSMNHKIKLILLYSIRFSGDHIGRFVSLLNEPSLVQLKLLNNFSKSFSSKIKHPKQEEENNFKKFFKNFSNTNEIDNIFLQYNPPLKDFLNDFLLLRADGNGHGLNTLVPDTLKESNIVQDVIIYFKNGVTYEEAKIVRDFNDTNRRFNLIIGSDKIINSNEWLEELYDFIN
ncbi:vacuolar protein sorting-associated protein 45 [Yamadazyma tenuis]|nr:vacuolar protein sorting-associated protein 45 [Yamadazyma tenuis]